jgi:thioredoxin 1
MKMERANDHDFDAKVRSATGTVIVDFTATYCAPCKTQAVVLEKLLARRSDVRVVEVDVEEAPRIAAELGVRAMPTLAVFEDGALKTKAVGLQTEARVEALMAR